MPKAEAVETIGCEAGVGVGSVFERVISDDPEKANSEAVENTTNDKNRYFFRRIRSSSTTPNNRPIRKVTE
jgi:hypothetical protein